MSTSNNIAFLTRSHNAIAAKKKARREQVKEVLFDDDARRSVFLSSFFLFIIHLHTVNF